MPALGLYEPIPEPSQVAQDWTAGMYEAIRKVVPEMVHKFERRFVAWQRTWAFCDSERLVSSLAGASGLTLWVFSESSLYTPLAYRSEAVSMTD